MRILYVTAELGTNNSKAGSTFPVVEVLRRLSKKNKIFLLTSMPFFIEGVKTILISNKKFLEMAELSATNREGQVKLLQKIIPDTRIPKVDVVVCSYYITWKIAKRIAKKQKAKLAVIYRMHNSLKISSGDERPYEHGWRNTIEQSMADESDLIVCQSEFEKNLIVAQYRVSKDRVKMIPNGVDFKEKKSCRKGVLFASRIEKCKGTTDLAFAAKKNPKLRFFACNSGVELEKIAAKNITAKIIVCNTGL